MTMSQVSSSIVNHELMFAKQSGVDKRPLTKINISVNDLTKDCLLRSERDSVMATCTVVTDVDKQDGT